MSCVQTTPAQARPPALPYNPWSELCVGTAIAFILLLLFVPLRSQAGGVVLSVLAAAMELFALLGFLTWREAKHKGHALTVGLFMVALVPFPALLFAVLAPVARILAAAALLLLGLRMYQQDRDRPISTRFAMSPRYVVFLFCLFYLLSGLMYGSVRIGPIW